jgi:hypothetical protein
MAVWETYHSLAGFTTHTQVITKVVLGMELSAKDRKDFENDFQIWLKEVGRPT